RHMPNAFNPGRWSSVAWGMISTHVWCTVRRQHMSGATMDPSDLPSNSPTPAVEAPVNQVRPPAAPTRTPSAPPTRGAGRPQATPPANRAAMIIGGILLAALLFVIGFFAGHASTGAIDLQATTISV